MWFKEKINKARLYKTIKKLLERYVVTDAFMGSAQYWENRYVEGRSSGSGSYGRLAHYKADFLNQFVAEKKIDKVIEFGSGDGHQLTLATYPSYIGFDVSQKAIDICNELFKDDHSKTFLLVTQENLKAQKASLTISLDVIYHLIEDHVYDTYMKTLFATSTQHVIIYASNYDKRIAPHVLCRQFTAWVKHHAPDWELITHAKNPYPSRLYNRHHTSMADFYIYQKTSSA